jgi:hypothetical protein
MNNIDILILIFLVYLFVMKRDKFECKNENFTQKTYNKNGHKPTDEQKKMCKYYGFKSCREFSEKCNNLRCPTYLGKELQCRKEGYPSCEDKIFHNKKIVFDDFYLESEEQCRNEGWESCADKDWCLEYKYPKFCEQKQEKQEIRKLEIDTIEKKERLKCTIKLSECDKVKNKDICRFKKQLFDNDCEYVTKKELCKEYNCKQETTINQILCNKSAKEFGEIFKTKKITDDFYHDFIKLCEKDPKKILINCSQLDPSPNENCDEFMSLMSRSACFDNLKRAPKELKQNKDYKYVKEICKNDPKQIIKCDSSKGKNEKFCTHYKKIQKLAQKEKEFFTQKEITIPNKKIIKYNISSYFIKNLWNYEDTALGNKSNTVWLFLKKEELNELKKGDIITGISFKIFYRISKKRPTHILNFKEYKIKMGNTTDPFNNNFYEKENMDKEINNVSDDYDEVRTGKYSYDSKKFEFSDYAQKLEFDTPFTYTGNNLIIKYTHSIPKKTCPDELNLNKCKQIQSFSALGIALNSVTNKKNSKIWYGKGFDAKNCKYYKNFFPDPNHFYPIIKFHIK